MNSFSGIGETHRVITGDLDNPIVINQFANPMHVAWMKIHSECRFIDKSIYTESDVPNLYSAANADNVISNID